MRDLLTPDVLIGFAAVSGWICGYFAAKVGMRQKLRDMERTSWAAARRHYTHLHQGKRLP